MANEDNSIEVNLRLFQEESLKRLGDFNDDFLTAAELMQDAMKTQIDRIADLATGAQTPTSATGSSQSPRAGSQFLPTFGDAAAKDEQVKESGAHRISQGQAALAASLTPGGTMREQLQRLTMAEQGVPSSLEDSAVWGRPQDSSKQGGVIGPFLRKHQRTLEQFSMGAAGMGAAVAAGRGFYNSPVATTGKALGYERGGFMGMGTKGWKSGIAHRWEAQKAGGFGFNPFVQGEGELANTMASMGFDMRGGSGGQMYDQLIDMGKKWGIDTSATAEFLESTKRFHPEDLGKVMTELDNLGDSAREAGMGVKAFSEGVMSGSAALSQQYGLGRSEFMTGLRQFGANTGLNPSLGAQLASNQQMVYATMGATGKDILDVTSDPELIFEESGRYVESLMGVDFTQWDKLSSGEQHRVKKLYAQYMADPQFQTITGGLNLEHFASVGGRQVATDAKAARTYIEDNEIFKDGVTPSEMEGAVGAYFGEDKLGAKRYIEAWESTGMDDKEIAQELANTVGADYDANAIEVMIGFTGKAKELLKAESVDPIDLAANAIPGLGSINTARKVYQSWRQ